MEEENLNFGWNHLTLAAPGPSPWILSILWSPALHLQPGPLLCLHLADWTYWKVKVCQRARKRHPSIHPTSMWTTITSSTTWPPPPNLLKQEPCPSLLAKAKHWRIILDFFPLSLTSLHAHPIYQQILLAPPLSYIQLLVFYHFNSGLLSPGPAELWGEACAGSREPWGQDPARPLWVSVSPSVGKVEQRGSFWLLLSFCPDLGARKSVHKTFHVKILFAFWPRQDTARTQEESVGTGGNDCLDL